MDNILKISSEILKDHIFLIDLVFVYLIWIVQIIIYPSFKFTSAELFKKWHDKYCFRVGFFDFVTSHGFFSSYPTVGQHLCTCAQRTICSKNARFARRADALRSARSRSLAPTCAASTGESARRAANASACARSQPSKASSSSAADDALRSSFLRLSACRAAPSRGTTRGPQGAAPPQGLTEVP